MAVGRGSSIRTTRWRACLLGLAFTWLTLVGVPDLPGPIRHGLDPGWMAGLHLAASKGLVAGKDIVWTYGPLGWLALPSATKEHFAAMLAYRLGLWALWAGALALLAVRTRRPAAMILLAVCAVNVIANGAFRYFLPDAQLGLAITATTLLAISSEGRSRQVSLAVLGVLGGLASVIKFNVAAEAVAVFIAAAGTAAWDQRRGGLVAMRPIAAAILILPLSSLGFYTAATGRPEYYLTYLRNALEISSGYSEGMSLPGPGFLVWLALATAAIPLLAIPLASRSKQALARGWLPAAAVCFLAFKHGVVRGDIHMLPILLNFSLAAAYLAFAAGNTRDRKRLTAAQLVMAPLGLWMVLGVAPGGTSYLADRLTLKTAATTLNAVIDFLAAKQELAIQNRASQAKMPVSPALAALVANRSVEVVPYETSYVWANHWDWRPRPIFQTYQVCSAAHDSLNAAHLAGPGAAELILFHWNPIDVRHPLFVDPLSWRATLDNYDAITLAGRFLVLRRRDHPRFAPPIELSTSSAAWSESVPVPDSPNPLLLSAEIPRSLLGNLANLFYRVAPVWLEVTTQGGSVTAWRVVRPNLAHGIFLCPFPTYIDELAQLAAPEFALKKRAIAVRFIADNPSQFAPTFSIRWLSLPLAQPGGSR